MSYRIVAHDHYLPDGSIITKFYVQQRKKFLGVPYWASIECENGMLSFDTYEEADNCVYHIQSSSYTV